MSDYDFDEPYVIIEKHESNVGSFLFGIAIGAGLALLFAPEAGTATRQRVRRQARRVTQRAQNVAADVTGTVVDSFQQARQEVEERIDAARSAIEIKRQQVTRAVEAGREAAHDAREELERRIAETKAAYDAGEPPTRSRTRAAPRTGTDDSSI